MAAAQNQGPNKPAPPAEQYQTILKEYQRAASGTGTSDEERKKDIARVDKIRDGLALKFLELAQKNPTDPIAADALIRGQTGRNLRPVTKTAGQTTEAPKVLSRKARRTA